MPATQTVTPGSRFGMPGFTRPITVRENNNGLTTALAQSASTYATGIIPFKQTDVVTHWDFKFSYAQSITGAPTVATSKYFPYNFIGQFQLNMQNQYNTINWLSGIDGAIFNLIRPVRYRYWQDALLTNFATTYGSQGNLQSASNYTSSSTAMTYRLQVPAAIWLDRFYNLDPQGNIISIVPNALVSPQYMAGTARIVQPSIQYNALVGGALDVNPFNFTGGTSPAITNTATLNILRNGYYQPTQPDGSDSPVIYPWQYVQTTKKVSLSGVSSADILIPFNGQVLSQYVRFWDPAANSGLGAPISISNSNITNAYVQYGSGLYRFQGDATDAQYQYVQEHATLLPEGVLAWDNAYNEQGQLTNQYALNTLNTSGVQFHFDFGSTLSSSAYAVVGIEGLQYVALGA